MDTDELKRKLRGLKKVEDRIRFGHCIAEASKKYVWDEYFSTKSVNDLMVKYPIWKLVKLDKEELKEVFEEYFYFVYFKKYKDDGIGFDEIHDPSFLAYFGLAPGASIDDIKSRFRELAKKYHPDHGGSNEKMVELLEAYHKLRNKEIWILEKNHGRYLYEKEFCIDFTCYYGSVVHWWIVYAV